MGEGIQEVQIHYKINNSLGCNMQPGNYSDSSESRSVVSDSLQPHRLYSPWNSPGQNTGAGSHSLLQGLFLTRGLNPGHPHCGQILYHLSRQGSPKEGRRGGINQESVINTYTLIKQVNNTGNSVFYNNLCFNSASLPKEAVGWVWSLGHSCQYLISVVIFPTIMCC